MPALELRLFGPPSIHVDGRTMPRLKTRKGLWLLALLALRNGREVDRNWLAGTLWPDAEEAAALTYLRQALTDLRKALGPASGLLTSARFRSLCLDMAGADCDVARFDNLLTIGTPEALQEAILLYRGPLLEGCTEEWVFQEREARAQEWLRALETVARGLETENPAAAVRCVRQVIAAEPLRESAYRGLMRALAGLGDAAAVMETYRDLRLLLRRELNTEPDPETRSLYDTIRTESRSRAVASSAFPVAVLASPRAPDYASAPDGPSGGFAPERKTEHRQLGLRLPQFVSEFIGREKEIAAVRRSLEASRLVTLTGVGGVGKTRLAVRIAEEEARNFSDGVAFVDFARLSEPSLVPDAVIAALGLREHPSRNGPEVLTAHLESRPTLLVLDNCEHLLAACAELGAELLTRCPELRILATSRQRLRISGETEWRVSPLEVPAALPHADALAAEDMLRSNEALRLFMDRALRARPTIATDMSTLRAAADVCRRLDGIPLALELAAARLQALTVAQLADRLEERFKLLVTGDITAPDRQKTLRAMLDWSHDLLSGGERILFRRLAVFAGGWTLEAVETACLGFPDSDFSLLDGLTSLVDKSLIQFSETSGDARYGMLETVRQYAREKLARSGEEADIRRIHRDHFISFAEEAASHLNGADQVQWLDRLESEHDNLRAALDWCARDPNSISAGLRLAGALRKFWNIRGHYAEARKWYSELLRADTAASPTSERALALHGAGNVTYAQGDYLAARDLFEQALAIRKELGDRAAEAETLTNLGHVTYFLTDYERARPLFLEALGLHRAAGNRSNATVALHGLGNLAFRTGDRAGARQWLEEGLAEAVACCNPAMEAANRVSLGLVHMADGDVEVAGEHFERALDINRTLGDEPAVTVCLTNLATMARKQGDALRSATRYRYALERARDRPGNRDERVVAYILEGVAYLATMLDKPREAIFLLAAGDALRACIAAPRPPLDTEDYDRAVAWARDTLGDREFSLAWSEGSSSKIDVAILRALACVAATAA